MDNVIVSGEEAGSITIEKQTDPDGATDSFSFTGTGPSGFPPTGCGLDSFTLNDDGEESCDNLAPGTYIITESSLAGWDLTDISCTGDAAVKFGDGTTFHDTFTEGDDSVKITLGAGESTTCTFTNTQQGSITAHKFNDLDGDGIQGTGEDDLSGWTMSLYSGSGCAGDPVQSGDTDGNGNVVFSGLTPGDYSVKETLKDGWTNTTDLCQNVTLSAGGSETLNFGNQPAGLPPPIGVGGEAYPVNKLAILAPWIALFAGIVVLAGTMLRRRRAQS